ncbi:SET domain-containing protein [Suhomyces tanzawaensis NRRL Y-17324]|uniref:SET domain-containing protein n=1 Tax=Suhomyces tanzawaensis NRRL Y-17324 TaxID=984487 RepID=A0A1E4SNM4_9ASCO|nr:SET domain-containing protein [Suhomyces tanzawaensis NRRL Y-17324]ODV81113.1 SET domain-containing protein [Suhomyces tanzawaensis NRRL Y-17324]
MTLAQIDQLLDWAAQNGAVVSKDLKFKEISTNNIGAIYESSQPSNDYQISLPINLVLTLKEATKGLNSGLTEGTFEEIANKTSNINSVLKLYLSRERSNNYLQKSFYQPYLQLLPTLEQINSPYTWSASDKALLKGTNLGESLRGNLTHIIEEWWQLINLLPESIDKPAEHFINMKFYYEHKFHTDDDLHKYFIQDEDINNWTSFPNYLWASLILKSRSFPAYLLKETTKVEYKKDEAMLLPIVDLLNHDSKAQVEWIVKDGFFNFKSNDAISKGSQIFNNYGMKGNEELLLAYGFCTENNPADSAALKIKIPEELIAELKSNGIKLPTLEDYTTSVVRSEGQEIQQDYKDGLLFFITQNNLPENLVQVFQYLIKNPWESGISLRMKLAGINQLRKALEAKNKLINPASSGSANARSVEIYTQSQKQIFQSTIKKLKSQEKKLLADPENKPKFITLKNVYKKDHKLLQSLLVSLGAVSYESILENELQDQVWLLYLLRCYNRDEYLTGEIDEDGDEENYLPLWIKEYFEKVEKMEVSAAELLQYRHLHEGLIVPLSKSVPEIYSKGKWGVKELALSAKLLDNISFVRGKEQECILVEPEQTS